MSKNLIILIVTLAAESARGASWLTLGDKFHANCAQNSCLISQGSLAFEVNMVVESEEKLDYLARLTIKNRSTGRIQTFETAEVNGVENHESFKIYRVNLQDAEMSDLALYAFNSAKAGPSYYYFLYDRSKQSFVQSKGTIPKLVVDPKTKSLRTDVQDVKFRIDNHQLHEM